MRCEEIMKTDVQCVRPNTSVRDCARRMRDRNIGFLPVCDQDNRVLGTITDRDVCCRIVADGLSIDDPVERYMSSGNLAICKPADDLNKAHQVLGRNKVSRLLVCDDANRLVGVISLSDIAQIADQSQASDTLRRVSAREAEPV